MLRNLCQLNVLDRRLIGLRLLATSSKSTKERSRAKRSEEVKPQITFAADEKDFSHDLQSLAEFLSRCLIRGGINSTVHSDFGKVPLADQLKKIDEMGIDYSVVLKGVTLKYGILGLRNRETTIHEQVHTSMLKRYLRYIFKPTTAPLKVESQQK